MSWSRTLPSAISRHPRSLTRQRTYVRGSHAIMPTSISHFAAGMTSGCAKTSVAGTSKTACRGYDVLCSRFRGRTTNTAHSSKTIGSRPAPPMWSYASWRIAVTRRIATNLTPSSTPRPGFCGNSSACRGVLSVHQPYLTVRPRTGGNDEGRKIVRLTAPDVQALAADADDVIVGNRPILARTAIARYIEHR